jgi:hypothetical protein
LPEFDENRAKRFEREAKPFASRPVQPPPKRGQPDDWAYKA